MAALGDVQCVVIDTSDLEADEIRQLLELCAARAPKVGLRTFQRRLKEDQERRREDRRKAASAAQADVDRREYRIVPPRDGEVEPVIRDIDRVLAAADSNLPPIRRADGTLVELRTIEPFDCTSSRPMERMGRLIAPRGASFPHRQNHYSLR